MPMQWDLFCRVVDNFGDIGVCWRLATDLASRGERVRLWADDASALRWMAPDSATGVSVLPWPEPLPAVEPGDVVIEAFGCNPPPSFVQRMVSRRVAPAWINLEYLSAEAGVERNHRLQSPQLSGAGVGLAKTFFYPGFTAQTGGLLRETDLMKRRLAFDPAAWLHSIGLERRADENVVSLFCYDNPALPNLLNSLAQQPTLLLATSGPAAQQVRRVLGSTLQRGELRAQVLPLLTQRDYDHLLWACDVNFVRGEDSFVRAQWAAQPFVWQIYPQDGGIHRIKLDAFLDRLLAGADADLAHLTRHLWHTWNGFSLQPMRFASPSSWQLHCVVWRDELLKHKDLASQLLSFVAETR